MAGDVWASGAAYEPYIGRWSRLVAAEFVRWLDAPTGARWVDVGCGTGALTAAVVASAQPSSVVGVDQSEEFVGYARAHVADGRAQFDVGSATDLPLDDGSVDVAVSGLMLNFVPDPARAVAELARVARTGGTVAAYVWDYADGMQLIRHFWDAARALDARAKELDEAVRFPLCRPERLHEVFTAAGLVDVRVRPIDVPTRFRDFDDYWTPFLGGQGPAPGYAMSVTEDERAELREHLRTRLPYDSDGSIPLVARAWAASGGRRAANR